MSVIGRFRTFQTTLLPVAQRWGGLMMTEESAPLSNMTNHALSRSDEEVAAPSES